MKHLLLVTSIGFAAGFAVSSCGTPVPPAACSPANCEGCCDSTDKCKTGGQEAACGTGGKACDVCIAGQVCASSVCAFAAVDAGTDAGFDAGTVDAGFDAGVVDAGSLCAPTPITCSDQAIQHLDLKATVNAGAVTNASEDGGFKTTIDATAGGLAPTMSFVYGKFSPTGMLKVSISDEASLASMDWDIAFRRFVIRLNSGSSGPSCVKAAVTPDGTVYDSLTAPTGPAALVDDFEGPPPTCTFKDDGSGLNTSPSTALANIGASFYRYNTCVAMTGSVFVVRTREGRNVKLLVTNYYPSDAAQLACNNGMSPMVAGATIKVRWSYLD